MAIETIMAKNSCQHFSTEFRKYLSRTVIKGKIYFFKIYISTFQHFSALLILALKIISEKTIQ
jgi:hypothetical protein